MGKLSSVTSGVTVGLAYTDTNADEALSGPMTNGEYLGDGTTTFWISKAF